MLRYGQSLKMCTKYPPAFQIDLLIDNCGGVAEEAERYHFEMLQIHPDDDDWVARIQNRIG